MVVKNRKEVVHKSAFAALFILLILFGSCSQENNGATGSSLNDQSLVGTWVRSGRYYLTLREDGKGIAARSKKTVLKEGAIPNDIKRQGKHIVNWVTYNNNFLLINADEKVVGFSYQVSGDTMFLRQPGDNLEYFLRVKEEVEEEVESDE